MKKTMLVTWIGGLIVAGVMLAPLHADCGKPHDGKGEKVSKTTSGCCPHFEAKIQQQASQTRTEYRPQLKALSKLKGMPVTSHTGQDLGKVSGIAVDPDANRAAYAILSSGGVLGIGETRHAIPFQLVRGSTDCDRLIAAVTKDELKNGPKFEDVEQLREHSHAEKIHRRYQVANYWQSTQQQKMDHPGHITMLEEFINEDIEDQQGNNIGTVKELMADLNNGHIAYVAVQPRGSGKLTAVPCDHVVVRAKGGDETQIIARVSAEELETAPSWKAGNPPDMTSNAWNERMYRHYEATPYYVVYGYVIVPTAEGETAAHRMDFATGQLRSFSGLIQNIEKKATGPGLSQPGTQVTLTSYEEKEGSEESMVAPQHRGASRRQADIKLSKELTVNLAPMSFLQTKGIALSQGQSMKAWGFVTEHGGQAVLVATQIEVSGKRLSLRNNQGQPMWSSR